MLAPEPFFEPGGTPFSEYHRIKALGDLGHQVDLVTYPIGRDVALPNLTIYRSWRPPFVRHVPIGPSLTKVVLDGLLTVTALRRALLGRYDAIHSHEEAGLLGVWLARWLGIPHLYDMHSSLPQQLSNFRYSGSGVIRRVFEAIERTMVRDSGVVITICQELQDAATALGAGNRAILIENVMGGDFDEPPASGGEGVREAWGIGPADPLILYTGTFEPYQGLDLLLEATARLQASHPEARVLIVGGGADQVAAARARADEAGAAVIFTGQQPASEIPRFIQACDILASPRNAGTNTPLKIYSYLRSGKPIAATRLRTHTQVLDDRSALLAEPDPGSFAAALARLVDRPDERAALAAGALHLAQTKYSRDSYLARTRQAYAMLMNRVADASRALCA
jgi:glycosyltransferase involved in cell wall biosynthesis